MSPVRAQPWLVLALLGACGAPHGTCPAGDAGAIAVTCPAPIELGCGPATGQPVTYTTTAQSCADPAPRVVCSVPSGATVPPGDTTVDCHATDRTGATAACSFVVHSPVPGEVTLACTPGPVMAECTGAATPVTVPPPRVEAACGAPPAVQNDAPAAGFPLGRTTVDFAAGPTARCTTVVDVADTTAPSVSCPASASVARLSPDAMVVPPAITVNDSCDPAPSVVATPATLATRGASTVTYVGSDAAGHHAMCTSSVTVLDAFAVTGLRVALATLDDGTAGAPTTGVTLLWEPSSGADATGYRVERAPSATGPWTALGTGPASALVFADAAVPGTEAYYRVVTFAGAVRGGATDPLRVRAIQGTTYDLRAQTVPGVTFATTVAAIVRAPMDLTAGPYPLVLLLHGNHGICRPASGATDDACQTSDDGECHAAGYTTTPNNAGETYLAETLASRGYVVATVDANALNCRNDYILERAHLLIEHLRRWRTWASAPGAAPFAAQFAGAVDLSRVGLAGHSRGGEAVAQVPALLAASPEAGITIASVFSIAPTDMHAADPGAVPYGVLVPACDGDVYTLDGIHIYDRTVPRAATTPSFQVFVIGANHDYFSTEWRFDDDVAFHHTCTAAEEIGAVAQQHTLAPLLTTWFDQTLSAPVRLEPFLRAEGPGLLGLAAWAGTMLDLRRSYAAPSRVRVDDLSEPGAPATNLLGDPDAFTGFASDAVCTAASCDPNWPHLRTAIALSWSDGETPEASWTLGTSGRDASDDPVVSFRMASRQSALNAGVAQQDLLIRVTDAHGAMAQVPLSQVQRVAVFYPTAMPRAVLQTVRVPLSAITSATSTLDPHAIASIDLAMTVAGNADGSILVTDVELAP